jgi:uncharacterized protein (TIGR02099 family)
VSCADVGVGFGYKGTIPQDAHLCSIPFVFVSRKTLRRLYWSALGVYFVASAIVLGVRYLVLPRIDTWRPQIERYVGQALGAQVVVGHIDADWRGLNPRLTLTDVVVNGEPVDPVMRVPRMSAVLAWRSVLFWRPRLLSLRLDKLDIAVRRDTSDRLWVAGQVFNLAGNDPEALRASPALKWLTAQDDVSVHDSTIVWIDEKRSAPPLTFSNVDFRIDNRFLSHRFRLRARAPSAAGTEIDIAGEFRRTGLLSAGVGKLPWSGQVYASADDVDPSHWMPWLAVPDASGRAAARAWLVVDHGQIGRTTIDVAARDAQWTSAGNSLTFGNVRAHIDGPPSVLLSDPALALVRSPGVSVSIALQADRGLLALPNVFAGPALTADTFTTTFALTANPNHLPTATIQRLQLTNSDLAADMHGRWSDDGKTVAGVADWEGQLTRASMPAIYRYFPQTIPKDVRFWLQKALVQGEANAVTFAIKGDLDDFPFDKAPGNFHVAGTMRDARLNYAVNANPLKPWPQLEDFSGTFAIDKLGLKIVSTGGGVMRSKQATQLDVPEIHADIPDMGDHNATLLLTARGNGPAQAYLDLINESPIGERLDGAVMKTHAGGQWDMPFKLRIPLTAPDRGTVSGTIDSKDSSFTFRPTLPSLQKLSGSLAFDEKGFDVRGLNGTLLGGPFRLSGHLRERDQDLKFSGQLSSDGLRALDKGRLLSRFSGRARYSGRIAYARGGVVDVNVQSDLRGMAVDLPAPLGKSAAEQLPVSISWQPAQNVVDTGKRWLSADVGTALHARFESDAARSQGSFFNRGIVAVNRPGDLPDKGVAIDASLPLVDLDAWQKVGDDLEAMAAGLPGAQPAGAFIAMPDRIALSTKEMRLSGFSFNDLTLAISQAKSDQWTANIQSREAAGTLTWQAPSDAVEGRLTARLDHLDLGNTEADATDNEPLTVNRDLKDVPAIDLTAGEFSLYGKPMGSLSVSGSNTSRGERWQLDKLQIVNGDSRLDASGMWRLTGGDRGLSAKAALTTPNLGALFERMGFPGKLVGGAGTLKGDLTWRDLPWSHNPVDISGTASVSLDKGRFSHLGSYTSRLLELLSLQSLGRLARLDILHFNPLREGFPFDTIRGHIQVGNGVITTDDYKINGPVATIVLAGSSFIIDRTWDVRAVVVPHLDASGAAIVAGLALNPLIGLGAFVTQWLLQSPLARALTAQYTVKGSWDDPKIDNAPVPVDKALKASRATPEFTGQ